MTEKSCYPVRPRISSSVIFISPQRMVITSQPRSKSRKRRVLLGRSPIGFITYTLGARKPWSRSSFAKHACETPWDSLRMPMKSCSGANGKHWASLLTTELHCYNRSANDFPRYHSFFIHGRSIQRMRSQFLRPVPSMQLGKVSITRNFWHVYAMRNDFVAGGGFCSPKSKRELVQPFPLSIVTIRHLSQNPILRVNG